MDNMVSCVSLGVEGGNHFSLLELNYLMYSTGFQVPSVLPEYNSKNDRHIS